MENKKQKTKNPKKRYEVTITRVSDRIEVEATSEQEARELAKKQVNYSVYESYADEVFE